MKNFVLIAIVATFVSLNALAADKKAAGGAKKSTPELIAKGKASFTTNCVTCHGEKGDGNGPAGQLMNPKPRSFSTDKFKAGDKPEQVFNTISKGLPGTAMAGYSHLPEEERWGLTYYVLSFKK